MPATVLDDNTALVLIDLQKGIAAGATVHPLDGVLANAAKLADAFRARKLPVVLVRVHWSDDGGDLPTGRTTAPGPKAPLPEGFATFVDELGDTTGDIVITKRHWGAFHGTELDVQLRRRGVTGIVLAGIATSIGVESTARAAYEHGYHVTIAHDATTDRDPQSHEHSVEKIFPRLGEVDSTEAILSLLKG
ncbi:hydrolase [Streptantibioticus cattleyicolor]|uniref:Putative hydrolase n=1 Tax=Streptantibioticus cattleyicolor (strain ATCC 35852 / DSM 46488 / JCM 4925 / NBRC 14057 / NRRL 8057) TaxID=1003195 RepID=F8JJZ1_STREN|nr:hydrolase [Streptantibioticus cattleyicolor]AEW98575.1 putative hydrolase [Streptantibioticus cattleyicolor NRRL 8057 = DSM 46488]CCB72366.1 putative hydrolase [Streptantibioticus cattleyicolor NRRL 8057 = DSM 46488]